MQQADGSHLTYTYDSGGRMTQIKDPTVERGHRSAYDRADRVGTIYAAGQHAPRQFTNDQESGWTNSGTSGSPAAATLLAQATSTYTDPNGNVDRRCGPTGGAWA